MIPLRPETPGAQEEHQEGDGNRRGFWAEVTSRVNPGLEGGEEGSRGDKWRRRGETFGVLSP